MKQKLKMPDKDVVVSVIELWKNSGNSVRKCCGTLKIRKQWCMTQ